MTTVFDPTKANNDMERLPLDFDLKDVDLLIQLNQTNATLATLDEAAKRIPNQNILIEFVSIKEWVSSNAIENIHTTIEDAFVAELSTNKKLIKQEDKETIHYKDALLYGFDKIRQNRMLVVNDIVKLNHILLENDQWILSSPNKHIEWPGGVIYTPPQGLDLIKSLLSNLEQYYNTFDEATEIDPLLKLPILHYQFEAIHPFGDGNGRIWRILSVLFLVLHKKLDLPILFLSEKIIEYKADYYNYLKAIDRREENSLKNFSLWFLLLVETQALQTQNTILKIEKLMADTKLIFKQHPKLSKIYSHELINYLFARPFYSIEGLQKVLGIHRHTATAYFGMMEKEGILEGIKVGRNQYYLFPNFLNILKYG